VADNDHVMAITLDQIDQAVADAFSVFHLLARSRQACL